MIEVIYKGEENDKRKNPEVKVPKNVQQIGETGSSRKIYIEDYVMTYLKDNSEEGEDIRYGVLLGNVKKGKGNTYVFVKGLVAVTDTIENSLIFNDEIWTGIYQDIKDYFDNFEIAGWYVSMPYRIKDDMSPIRKIHLDNFAGNDKICYVNDRSENEEGFYIFDNGRMEKQEGYYIYYERNANMQKYLNEKIRGTNTVKIGYNRKKDEKNEESIMKKVINMTPQFLKSIQSKDKKTETKQQEAVNIAEKPESLRDIVQKQKKTTLKPGYAIATVAVIALLLSAIGMLNNYGELKNIQSSLEALADSGKVLQVNSSVSETSESNAEDGSADETNTGETTEEDDSDAGQAANSGTETQESSAGGETDTQEDTSGLTGTGQDTYENTDSDSEETTPASVSTDNYCIVESGQTLYDISMTYYNTSSMVDDIKEANGIDDEYTIYEGQKIILP